MNPLKTLWRAIARLFPLVRRVERLEHDNASLAYDLMIFHGEIEKIRGELGQRASEIDTGHNTLFQQIIYFREKLDSLHFALDNVIGCDSIVHGVKDGQMVLRGFTGQTPLQARIEALVARVAKLEAKKRPPAKKKTPKKPLRKRTRVAK